METTSLREARKRLGDLVRAAEHGETVVITRRGRMVARIVAERPRKPRTGFPDLTKFRKSIRLKGKAMSRTVIEMRREERI